MKSLVITICALLAFSGVVQAQAPQGSVSPNPVNQGDNVTVTMTGLQASTTYVIIFSGVGENGTEVNASREVTTNAAGSATWTESTSGWGNDDYATNVSHRIGGGQPSNTASGSLTVQPQ